MLLNYAVIKKMENWKKIADFDNYSVSDKGRVRNDKTGRILKLNKLINGYEQVSLSKNCFVTCMLVHRLVANAFIQNPDNKPQVDHIDNCKINNCVENLRWVNQSENEYNKDKSRNAKYIYYHGRTDGFNIKVSINKIQISRYAPTMEDAIRIRDELLLQRKSEMGF